MLYLDNSATTRPYPEVIEAVSKVMERHYGNPSSIHRLGVESEKVLEQAREVSAKILGVRSSEVFFTSGATESNNLAIKGAAFQYQSRGKHLITTEVEHPSVYAAFQQLESLGFRVSYLPVDGDGRVRVSDLQDAITEETTLVSIMYVNNEVGTVQPIEEIAQLLQRYPKLYLHVDAVQAYGKIPLRIKGIDLLSLSAHKFHGPKGAGLLYKRDGVRLMPLFSGGDQESALRAGTENLAGIVGMVKAMRMVKDRMAEDIVALERLKAHLMKRVGALPAVRLNTPPDVSAPHIVNISVPGLKAEVLVHALEHEGYYVSTRSACSSKKIELSRVLLAMGAPEDVAGSSVRISLEPNIDLEQLDAFVDTFHRVVAELQSAVR